MLEFIRFAGRPAVRSTLLPLAFFVGLLTSVPAAAQDYPARDIGGWTVAASRDKGGCFVTRTYAGTGGTTVLLGLNIDGGNHLTVLNDNWSIKPRDQLKLSFRFSRVGYPEHPVVGMASGGKKGFVTDFDPRFPTLFATSKELQIDRGDVPVERLNLDGSGAAVAELRNCVGIVGAGRASGAQGAERSGLLPRDPFAPDVKPPPKD